MGGIGACSKALERLGIDYEIADYVEIDKYAVGSFNAIHGTNFEPQDICNWNKDIEIDLIMHGSPCQDFSLAGKQAGGDKDSGTRSSLMYETIRIVEKLRPRYVIWENVKNLLSKKHRHNFDTYLYTMKELGYTNYYQVLNAKDYGIPQNRERIFTVSILGNESYKFPKGNIREAEVVNPLKGLSGKSWQFEQNVYTENSILRSLKAGGGSGNIPKVIENFEFPQKRELKLKLKGILECEVAEKYYLNEKNIKHYQREFGSKGKELNIEDIAPTLTAAMGSGGGNVPYFEFPPKQPPAISTDGIGPTLTSAMGQGGGHVPMHNYGVRIRKLTPKECWRLMGFDDTDFEKAEKVNSNTQLYKQAGNSIVVNVLEAILKNLLEV